jgi:hypothetical protein
MKSNFSLVTNIVKESAWLSNSAVFIIGLLYTFGVTHHLHSSVIVPLEALINIVDALNMHGCADRWEVLLPATCRHSAITMFMNRSRPLCTLQIGVDF